MPSSKVTSAPQAPVPARANTGRSAGSAQRLRLRRRPAEASRPAGMEGGHAPHAVPLYRRADPAAAPTARLDPFCSRRAPARCRRAAATDVAAEVLCIELPNVFGRVEQRFRAQLNRTRSTSSDIPSGGNGSTRDGDADALVSANRVEVERGWGGHGDR